MAVHRVGAEQSAIADYVDDARDSDSQSINFGKRGRGEYVTGRSSYAQPMPHVGCGLFVSEGIEVVAPRDALGQLSQLVARQQLAQLRLAGEEDLQQLARVGFK